MNDWGISVCCSGFILETCHLSVPAAQNPLLGSSTYHSPLQRKSSEVDPPLSPEGTGCKLASSRGKDWPHRSEKKVNIRQWHPTPVLLPGKSHGWRSLAGCSPWGREESDMTEQLHFHSSLSCIGEGNGNPLQCSCLENPRDGTAWWAAIYGVAQSRTRLK